MSRMLSQLQHRDDDWQPAPPARYAPAPELTPQEEESTARLAHILDSYHPGDLAPPDVSAMPVYGGQAETPEEAAKPAPPRVAHDDPGY